MQKNEKIKFLVVFSLIILLAAAGPLHSAEEQPESGPSSEDEAGVIMLEPIVVHGERSTRSMRETASSVSVFDSKTLGEQLDMTTGNDLLSHLANIIRTQTGNFAPAVRGVDGSGPSMGADAFFAGTRPRLALLIDGRPAGYNELIFSDMSLWDVEYVEVFRGAQSTLNGRNSIAGAVVVKTKDPVYYWKGGGRLSAGNLSNRRYAAMVSGPLGEDVAFRLSAERKTSESFLELPGYENVHDPGAFEYTGARVKLLFEPKGVSGLSNLLIASYSDYIGPQGELVGRPFSEKKTAISTPSTFNPRAVNAAMETSWAFSDAWTLENTASYNDVKVIRAAPTGVGNAELTTGELLVEPRLRFASGNNRLKGFFGLYYFKADQDEWIDIGGDNTFDDTTRTTAVYSEMTLQLVKNVAVTLGARFEEERRERIGGIAPIFDIDLDETYDAFLPKASVAWHGDTGVSVGAMVSRGFNGGGAGFSFAPPFVAYTYEPEYVWNYEAFARTELMENRMTLNANVFLSDYSDIQLPFMLGPMSSVIRNADEAKTCGVELGAVWLLTESLKLSGDIGLLKSEITRYPNSNFEGNELPRAPAFTADLGFLYKGENGFELGADLRYSGSYYSDVNNTPRAEVDPYLTVNLQTGFTFKGIRWFAVVKNLFDADDVTFFHYIAADESGDMANMLQPRTWEVGAELYF